MTAVYNPLGQCRGKHTYGSKREAKRQARQFQTVAGGVGHLVAYRCPHYSSFHVGHPVRKLA